ncbi:MAG TPA: Mur ligase family protein [Iamia sp.]|nr:Mur ligase family protein [Iamia sp.]
MSFDAHAYLRTRVDIEAQAGRAVGLSIDPIKTALEALGRPQEDLHAIHVTGTNGKGSVAEMATRLLLAAGLRVGTYISPDLGRPADRIKIDGEGVSDDEFADALEAVSWAEEASGAKLSKFESLTAAAFRVFSDEAVDAAVVEVGMLGTFDATNVIDADVAVVTNIGRDHTDGRGDWRRAVATEKLGISKDRSTLLFGERDPVLREVAEATPARARWYRDEDFGCERNRVAVGGRVVDLRTPEATYDDLLIPVHGAHQADNASIALASVEAFFGRPLGDEVVRAAFEAISLPGRFEVVGRQPTVIIDGAHNIDGARTVAATIRDEMTLHGSLIFVVGLLRGRDPVEMLEALGAGDAAIVVACTPPSPRAIPSTALAAAATSMGLVAEAVNHPAEALRRARDIATDDDLIVAVGSLSLVGPLRAAAKDLEIAS